MRAHAVLRSLSVLLLASALLSCTDNLSIFSSDEDSTGVRLSAPGSGEVLSPGAAIAVGLTYAANVTDLERANRLVVELTTVDGEVLAAVELDSALLAQPTLPPVTLPDVEPGVYLLRYRASSSSGELLNEQRQVFVSAQRAAVAAILAYPPIIEPNSQALVRATVDVAPEHRPYIVWTLADQRIGEGYVEQAATAVIETPRTAGVYQLTAELWPFGPDEGAVISAPAPSRRGLELFVVERRTPSADELQPAEDYLVLYNLAGNLRNSAALPMGTTAGMLDGRRIGVPQPVVRDELFGYAVDEQNGIELPLSLLPTADQTVYVDMRFWIPQPELGAHVLRSDSNAGERLTLRLTSDGTFVVGYCESHGAEPVEYALVSVPPGQVLQGALEILRETGLLRVMWHSAAGGFGLSIPSAVDARSLGTDGASPWLSGTVRLGAAEGASAVWDEFGVRTSLSAAQLIRRSIHDALVSRYGDRLLIAEVLPTLEDALELEVPTIDEGGVVTALLRSRGDAGSMRGQWLDEDGDQIITFHIEPHQIRIFEPGLSTPLLSIPFGGEAIEMLWHAEDGHFALQLGDEREPVPWEHRVQPVPHAVVLTAGAPRATRLAYAALIVEPSP